ncbi:hypothetical protein IOK49_03735 [Fervidicoccus fontis]|uniref:Uncharacterized protein n=2 Tax=Fervidicoccus fontis TaxID=683846 RepID=I0A0S4_FERFK|nr:hypothetical protein [Fervidicoccus fontis]AFH42581.1 hypothetical protein FFONT_0591 [Fervidicoccus fontis Kam940]MBE9391189.1 hypothetical protein [Fervidicoccus fontis]PMB75689.1 MAG: two-component system response regulator BasR [Fervidicoccus fontis]PMB78181.1 MAG: two-component system response regulator BasR [Fervidicoccus fontis]HEW64011.1 hypothetical protein [Fervidicoccus fontis]
MERMILIARAQDVSEETALGLKKCIDDYSIKSFPLINPLIYDTRAFNWSEGKYTELVIKLLREQLSFEEVPAVIIVGDLIDIKGYACNKALKVCLLQKDFVKTDGVIKEILSALEFF